MRTLEEAHIPSFVKGIIHSIRHPQAGTRWTYYRLGKRIGSDHETFFPDLDEQFSDAEWNDIFLWVGDRYFLKDGVSPTKTLRRLFTNEFHLKGDGDLVRQIPKNRRYDYLCGIADGIAFS